jgi:hypothetical protein
MLDIEGFFNYKEFDFDKNNYSKKIDEIWEKCFTNDFVYCINYYGKNGWLV